MTGWRIGAVTAPKELVRRMALLLETIASCVSPFIQSAAEEAISGDQSYIDNMIDTFRERRDLMHNLINKLDLVSSIKPEGAFYTFVNIKKTGLSDIEFSEKLLNLYGVATCPGSFFGEGGKGYVRFCFATDEKNIRKGIKKVGKFIKSLK